MGKIFTVKLKEIIKTLKLKKVYFQDGMEEIEVACADVNRPGLQLIGFFDYFDPTRIQIIGKVEMTYLAQMTEKERKESVNMLFSSGIPAVILTRNLEPFPEMLEAAERSNVPILSTEEVTSRFMSELSRNLNVWLAPRITRHGVLVEVYGEGILILAESGVGKSETAIELVKRGHRLVADDAVEIKKVSSASLVGSAPEIIRHFIELRGIGIVNVRDIFGMGAIKDTEKIDLIIHLEHWRDGYEYDRLGLETVYTDILGVKIPSLKVPVRQGRNLAVIVEVAAMNNRQKRMGFNAAEELQKRLTDNMDVGD